MGVRRESCFWRVVLFSVIILNVAIEYTFRMEIYVRRSCCYGSPTLQTLGKVPEPARSVPAFLLNLPSACSSWDCASGKFVRSAMSPAKCPEAFHNDFTVGTVGPEVLVFPCHRVRDAP